MSIAITIVEAADRLGVTTAAVYYHTKRRPELFGEGPTGKTITLENLEKLRERLPMGSASARKASPPPPPPAPIPVRPLKSMAPNTRIREVGFWCRKCGDLMPGFRLDCRCLWSELQPKAIEKHKADSWIPAYVELHVTMAGANRK